MSDARLTVELEDKIAVIAMDDGKANVLGPPMIEQLQSALDRAQADARAVVLTGRPGRLSGGFDLKVLMASQDSAFELLGLGTDLLTRLYEFPLPVVVACTGHAVAAGALLLLAADTRIGADGEFKIGLNEVQIGMTVPILVQELARDRLDRRRHTEAIVQATMYPPRAAAEAGFLDQVVDPDAVLETAKAQAKKLCTLSAKAYANTKARMREATITKIRGTYVRDIRGIVSAMGQ